MTLEQLAEMVRQAAEKNDLSLSDVMKVAGIKPLFSPPSNTANKEGTAEPIRSFGGIVV